MNLTIKNLTSQYEKLPEQQLSSLFVADPFTWFVYNLTDVEKELFNLLVWADNNKQFTYFSQLQLAKKIGTTRETINRMLAKLKRFGLVSFKQLGYNLPCVYKIHSYFRTLNARDCLSQLLPAIKKRIFKFIDNFLPNGIKSHYHKQLIKSFINKTRQDKYLYSAVGQQRSGEGEEMTFEEKKKVLQRMRNGELGLSAITPAIENFKSLQLTTAGMVMLTGYMDEIIAYADECLAKKINYSKLDNPFGYVIGICRSKSAELGMPVQGAFAHQLREFYKIELDAPKHQPIVRSSSSTNSYQPIARVPSRNQKGDIDTFAGQLESLSLSELRTALEQELAKNDNLTHSNNPYQIVGADGNKVLSLRKRIKALEGERPSSRFTPCQEYAHFQWIGSQPIPPLLQGLFPRVLENHRRACHNYCGDSMSVGPSRPPQRNGTKFDDSEKMEYEHDQSIYEEKSFNLGLRRCDSAQQAGEI
jgi:predicted transcriptional regulator